MFLRQLRYLLRHRPLWFVPGATVLLCACVAVYLLQMEKLETLLHTLTKTVPVRVEVLSLSGKAEDGLDISAQRYDLFVSVPMRDIRCTSEAFGNFEEGAEESLKILAVNDFAALEDFDGVQFTYADGESEALFASDRPVCALSDTAARQLGVQPGDRFPLSVSLLLHDLAGDYRAVLSEPYACEFTVGAIFSGPYRGQKDMLCPVAYLRALADERSEYGRYRIGRDKEAKSYFSYASLSGTLAEDADLNAVKAALHVPRGFVEANPLDSYQVEGGALRFDDQLFIETAGQVTLTLSIFRAFLVPVFIVLLLLLGVLAFFLLRGTQRELALEFSVGNGRRRSAAVRITAMLLLHLAGCVLVFPALLAAHLGAGMALAVCGLFLVCACGGSAAAMAVLLRVDALSLLTRID